MQKKVEATPHPKPQGTGKVWKPTPLHNEKKSSNKSETTPEKWKGKETNSKIVNNADTKDHSCLADEDEDLLDGLTEEELIELAGL